MHRGWTFPSEAPTVHLGGVRAPLHLGAATFSFGGSIHVYEDDD